MSRLNRGAALYRESELALRIPYTAQVSDGVVKTAFGHYVRTFRLAGASFQSADDIELDLWHERLNVLWRG
ncbi:MAG: hypothetical protein ACREUG_03230, partial [Steroidobacteraceae bacterium]